MALPRALRPLRDVAHRRRVRDRDARATHRSNAEPDDDPAAIADVLDDAEGIVEGAEHDVERDLQRAESRGERPWWKVWKRRPPDDPFRISNR